MKKSLLFGATAFLLFGCMTAKMQPQERFLSLNPDENKIVILSVMPAQGDSSGTYLSTLIFNQQGKQATVFARTFDPDPLRETRHNYFGEQLVYFDTTRFPVVAQTDTADTYKHFHFFLTRNRMIFGGGFAHTLLRYELRFEKQLPFQTQSPRTDFRIGGIVPLDVTCNKINIGQDNKMRSQKLFTPSVMMYHTLENSDLLLASADKTYYWIDFYRFGETGYSCFFEKDASGATRVLYSTLPAGEQLNAELYYTTDNSGVLLLQLSSPVSDEKLMISPLDKKPLPVNQRDHTVKTVVVTENNIPVGAGILYQL